MSTATEQIKTPTYGNWRRPRKAGLGSLGLIGTFGLFGGLVVVLIASMISLDAALVVGLPFALVLAPLAIRTQDGRNVFQMAGVRVGWMRRRSKRQHLYVSGPLSTRPGGRFRPPGLLSRVTMLEGRDPYDRPFGVLHHRNRHQYTIVLSCEPDGGSLVDPDQVDTWVALWGSGCPGWRTSRGCVARRWWWRPPPTRAPGSPPRCWAGSPRTRRPPPGR